MTQQEKHELFIKMQERINSNKFKDMAVEEIKEYIDKNFTDIKSINLGDKEIYIIPTEKYKPIKIVLEN